MNASIPVIADPKVTRHILSAFHLRASKRLGQNFLVDAGVVRAIVDVADLSPADTVLEIGPGIGTLTQGLAESGARIVAVELDKKLPAVLAETLKGYDNVTVVPGDILKLDILRILNLGAGERFKVVANLPYYITTPILMALLEQHLPIERMVTMVQKEVALRMKAAPGTKDYGALSLAVQYYSEPAIVQEVPPHCFIPRPNVSSSVIHLRLHKKAPVSVQDPALLFKTIKFSFMQRRKTLVNALASGFHLDKRQLQDLLSSLSYPENVRGETLSLADFSLISDGIREILSR